MDGVDHPTQFTRREAIQLLGGAAGLCLVAGCAESGELDAGDQSATVEAIIRTLRGDISPDALLCVGIAR